MKKLHLVLITSLLFQYRESLSQTLTNTAPATTPASPNNGAYIVNALNNRVNLLQLGVFGRNGNDIYQSIGRNDINSIGSVAPNYSNLYGFTSTANSDRLFMGVMHDDNGSDNHSLINWGDDQSDLLLFRHSTPSGSFTNNASFWANSRIRFGPHALANSFTTAPTTTLEIEAGNGVLSGLKFPNLWNNTAVTNLWNNPSNRFLTVDNGGNVVLSQGPPLNNWLLTGNSGISNPTHTSGYGSSISTGNFIGTINNAAFAMATNNIERMRITESGTVGIGTDNPSASLHVTGMIMSQAPSRPSWGFATINTGGNGVTGISEYFTGPGSRLGFIGWSSTDMRYSAENNNTAGHVFHTMSGVERMRITAGGNVGIGTITRAALADRIPLAKLDVYQGKIISGEGNATQGSSIIEGSYDQTATSDNTLNVIGSSYSSGGTSIQYATRNMRGLGAKDRFVSSTPISIGRSAINMDEHMKFFTAPSQTVAIGQPIANMTEKMRITNAGNVGINNPNPLNKLEVTGNFNTQQNLNASNISGLRLTDLDKLNRNPTIAPNPTGTVLTVNGDGDVILVKTPNSAVNDVANGLTLIGGVAHLGRSCGATGAELLDSREIPLNNNNIIFSDGPNHPTVLNNNRIGIGTFSGGCSPTAKLEVNRAFVPNKTELFRTGISSIVSDGGDRQHDEIAYLGKVNGSNTSTNGGHNRGIDVEVDNASQNTGMWLRVGQINNNATISQGAFIQATAKTKSQGMFASATASQEAIGGLFRASGSLGNIGVKGIAHNADGGSNYGVYGEINGVGTAKDWALFGNGQCGSTSGVFLTSDEKLKKDISEIERPLDLISKINPKKYDFDNEKFPRINLPLQKDNYGVLAQELEKVLPGLVAEAIIPGDDKNNPETIKLVNYTELIPITIAAIKELNAKVEKQSNTVVEYEALKLELESVKKKLANYDEKFTLLEKTISMLCESGCEGLKKAGEVESSEVDLLYQSIPNPTHSEALINYSLGKEYTNAYIIVSTQEGKQLKTIKLDAKTGAHFIRLDLGELANGIYLYTLVAGGRVIDTKRIQVLK